MSKNDTLVKKHRWLSQKIRYARRRVFSGERPYMLYAQRLKEGYNAVDRFLYDAIKNRRRFSFGAEKGASVFSNAFFISAICHAVFFAALLFYLDMTPPVAKKKIPVIQVKMIGPERIKSAKTPTRAPKSEKVKPKKVKPKKKQSEKPKPETAKLEKPKPETPKTETPKLEKPKPETPKTETPKSETPKSKKTKIKKPESKEPAPHEEKPPPKVSLPAPPDIGKIDKKKVKKSLKKDTYDAVKARKSALEKVREKIKKESKKNMAAPKKPLKPKPKPKTEPDAKPRIKSEPEDEKNEFENRFGNESNADRIAEPGDLIKLKRLDRYNTEIKNRIERNWAYSPLLTKEFLRLEALVSISIMANGEIKDINLDKKSGSQYFDESIYQAALKSNPFPPLPELPSGYKAPHIIRFRFIPPEK